MWTYHHVSYYHAESVYSMAKLLGCVGVETDELWGHGHFVPLKVSMANLNRSVSCENLSFTLYTLICNMVTHECCLADIYLLITVVICCSYFNTCDLLQACGKLLCVWRLTWCMQTVSIGGSMIWNPGFVCVYAVYVFPVELVRSMSSNSTPVPG